MLDIIICVRGFLDALPAESVTYWTYKLTKRVTVFNAYFKPKHIWLFYFLHDTNKHYAVPPIFVFLQL